MVYIIEWLLGIFDRCIETGAVQGGDKKVARIVRIYKGRRDRRVCVNYS